jgi:hypothetical protein
MGQIGGFAASSWLVRQVARWTLAKVCIEVPVVCGIYELRCVSFCGSSIQQNPGLLRDPCFCAVVLCGGCSSFSS